MAGLTGSIRSAGVAVTQGRVHVLNDERQQLTATCCIRSKLVCGTVRNKHILAAYNSTYAGKTIRNKKWSERSVWHSRYETSRISETRNSAEHFNEMLCGSGNLGAPLILAG